MSESNWNVKGPDWLIKDTTNHFPTQIEIVKSLLEKEKYTHIIANSFGAYILMHCALRNNISIKSKILLLSPVLGQVSGVSSNGSMYFHMPPAYKRLEKAIKEDKFTFFNNSLQVITGENDKHNTKEQLELLEHSVIGANIELIKESGHSLPHKILQNRIKLFLES